MKVYESSTVSPEVVREGSLDQNLSPVTVHCLQEWPDSCQNGILVSPNAISAPPYSLPIEQVVLKAIVHPAAAR